MTCTNTVKSSGYSNSVIACEFCAALLSSPLLFSYLRMYQIRRMQVSVVCYNLIKSPNSAPFQRTTLLG
jgi:hypothetical protein